MYKTKPNVLEWVNLDLSLVNTLLNVKFTSEETDNEKLRPQLESKVMDTHENRINDITNSTINPTEVLNVIEIEEKSHLGKDEIVLHPHKDTQIEETKTITPKPLNMPTPKKPILEMSILEKLE